MGLFTDLSTALAWIAAQQPGEMVLGLDRVKIVAERLSLLSPTCPVVIVGGTNGKGSTVAGLEAVYRAAGFKVGTFTSPILFKHNEYVHIDGREVSDEMFVAAYAAIAEVKGDVLLTPFEFHTLAALWMFKRSTLDVIILEVGLGGRLDAVNIIDADVAVVTSIDIDHADYLGDTREKIGFEKAGIFRKNKFAICGDENPPLSLIEYAEKIGAIYVPAHTERVRATTQTRNNNDVARTRSVCAGSLLCPSNISCVIKTVELLQDKLLVAENVIEIALKNLQVTGRVQIIPGEITYIFDVSHNPASVAYLANRLRDLPCTGKTIAVFSMLADKDIQESVKQIANEIDAWFVAPLAVPRGATKEQLLQALNTVNIQPQMFDDIETAFQTAKNAAKSGDRVVVFGSFNVVARMSAFLIRGNVASF